MKVEIKKKNKKLIVTDSAFNNFYKNAGWELSSPSQASKKEVVEDVKKEEVENTEQELDEIEEDWDSIEDDEEVSKPISEMNNAELKEYATKLGIDISGLSSNKQLREAIKAVI